MTTKRQRQADPATEAAHICRTAGRQLPAFLKGLEAMREAGASLGDDLRTLDPVERVQRLKALGGMTKILTEAFEAAVGSETFADYFGARTSLAVLLVSDDYLEARKAIAEHAGTGRWKESE